MPEITFSGLTDLAHEPRSLPGGTAIARFAVSSGGEATARLDDLLTFTDLQRAAMWRPAHRAALLEALARSILEAPWRDEARRELALGPRFFLTDDDDDPAWRFIGAINVRTVDRKLIKHVLGAQPEAEPEAACVRWEVRLGTALDRPSLRAGLEGAGCDAFARLRVAAEQGRDDTTLDPYAGLGRADHVRCLALLSPLRERYLRAVRKAMTAASRIARARHVHLGAAARRMRFLADDGLFVVTEGSCATALGLATAYDAVEPGESGAGPLTLRSRWRRVVSDMRAGDVPFAVHSPLAWGVGRR